MDLNLRNPTARCQAWPSKALAFRPWSNAGAFLVRYSIIFITFLRWTTANYVTQGKAVMDAQEGALCQTCFVGTLQLAAGILVCDTCGGTQQV
jgi:hypothetical protein